VNILSQEIRKFKQNEEPDLSNGFKINKLKMIRIVK